MLPVYICGTPIPTLGYCRWKAKNKKQRKEKKGKEICKDTVKKIVKI
jgi:hypothetical protein